MSQYTFATIDPYTKTGDSLVLDLNSWRNAVHTSHSGTVTPTYAVAGMPWLSTAAAPWSWNVYDGVDNIKLCSVDATNNYATVDAPQAIYLPTVYPSGSPPASDICWDQSQAGISIAGADTAQAILPRDWEFVAKGQYSGTGASSIAFTNLAAFRVLRLFLYVEQTSSDAGAIYLQTSINNGVAYEGGATDYESNWEWNSSMSASSIVHDVLTGDTSAWIGLAYAQSVPTYYCAEITLYEFNIARYTVGHWVSANYYDFLDELQFGTGTFRRIGNVVNNAFRVLPFATWEKYFYYLQGIRS